MAQNIQLCPFWPLKYSQINLILNKVQISHSNSMDSQYGALNTWNLFILYYISLYQKYYLNVVLSIFARFITPMQGVNTLKIKRPPFQGKWCQCMQINTHLLWIGSKLLSNIMHPWNQILYCIPYQVWIVNSPVFFSDCKIATTKQQVLDLKIYIKLFV